MSRPAAEVLAYGIERTRDRVQVLLKTAQGDALVAFTHATAHAFAIELGTDSVLPVGERRNHSEAAAAGLPLLKPRRNTL